LDPSSGDPPCSTLPRFLCGAALLAAGRGLNGAGDVLCLIADGRRLGGAGEILPLVAGRVGPRRSRRCPLPHCWHRGASAEQGLVDASGAGTHQSRHCPLPRPRSRQTAPRPLHRPICRRPQPPPPACGTASARGGPRGQSGTIRAAPPAPPAPRQLLLRLQVLLEEMGVVSGVGLHLPELLLRLLPHRVHILGTGLADGHGAMHRQGWRGGGGWRRTVDYHVLHWDVIVLWLPGSQPVGSNGFHLLVVCRLPVLKSAGA